MLVKGATGDYVTIVCAANYGPRPLLRGTCEVISYSLTLNFIHDGVRQNDSNESIRFFIWLNN